MTYDVTNAQSFENIGDFWLNEVQTYGDNEILKYLIGNKSDAVEERCVS